MAPRGNVFRVLISAALLLLASPAVAADSPRALLGADTCPVSLPDKGGWTEAEKWTWERVCTGEWTYLNRRDETTLPCNPAEIDGEVPPHRRLSANFLHLILTHPLYQGALAKPQINISCASIEGQLDLENERIAPELGLFWTHLRNGVILRGARFDRSVFLQGSRVDGTLSADRVRIAGNLFLRDGSTVTGDVRLLGAKIDGDVVAEDSSFQAAFLADEMKVGGRLFLSNGSTVAGDIRLLGAKIDGNVEANGSTFQAAFRADRMQVGGSLFLSSGATVTGDVRLLAAKIDGSVSANGSTFHAAFRADRMQVGGGLFLRDGTTLTGDVRLLGAKIDGDISANGSTFHAAFHADRMHLGGNLLLRNGTAVSGDVDLSGAEIGGFLQLQGSTFEGTISANEIQVGEELRLSYPGNPNPEWGEDASMLLRNATVGALQAEIEAWRTDKNRWLTTDLTGFTYHRLGGFGAHRASDGMNMADAPADSLVEWIEQSQPDHDFRYDPHPYTQLAEALDRAGAAAIADQVRYARFEHKRRAGNTPLREKIVLEIGKYLVGYGVFPFRALYWFAGLVVCGVLIASLSRSPALRGSGAKFWYSLENALPLMELAESHKNLNHDNGFVTGFFHAQKVLGFVLATILIGALSLLGG
jgi:cytoskeletal protein CcmA (bactofilin family)